MEVCSLFSHRGQGWPTSSRKTPWETQQIQRRSLRLSSVASSRILFDMQTCTSYAGARRLDDPLDARQSTPASLGEWSSGTFLRRSPACSYCDFLNFLVPSHLQVARSTLLHLVRRSNDHQVARTTKWQGSQPFDSVE